MLSPVLFLRQLCWVHVIISCLSKAVLARDFLLSELCLSLGGFLCMYVEDIPIEDETASNELS